MKKIVFLVLFLVIAIDIVAEAFTCQTDADCGLKSDPDPDNVNHRDFMIAKSHEQDETHQDAGAGKNGDKNGGGEITNRMVTIMEMAGEETFLVVPMVVLQENTQNFTFGWCRMETRMLYDGCCKPSYRGCSYCYRTIDKRGSCRIPCFRVQAKGKVEVLHRLLRWLDYQPLQLLDASSPSGHLGHWSRSSWSPDLLGNQPPERMDSYPLSLVSLRPMDHKASSKHSKPSGYNKLENKNVVAEATTCETDTDCGQGSGPVPEFDKIKHRDFMIERSHEQDETHQDAGAGKNGDKNGGGEITNRMVTIMEMAGEETILVVPMVVVRRVEGRMMLVQWWGWSSNEYDDEIEELTSKI
ncbi:hypothetical protein NE237_009788 [Protea cynaroides]|uniref:Uncharacterized protein n=1 Tax=Protea cynaroides TaxID=273540 RepID=A0A9Q0KYB7_9MAGN|nr:hypothetical protein NE237_009788 [Protea cynaroides]